MSEYYTGNSDGITHSQIVHELLRKIAVDLATKEFRGGYYNLSHTSTGEHKSYVPDARREFTQAVESLAMILLPSFDNKMEEAMKAYDEKIKSYIKEFEDDEKKVVETAKTQRCEAVKGEGSLAFRNLTAKKNNAAKGLFRELNLLLKRTNYLQSAPYSEDDDEDDEQEEGFNEESD